MFVAKDYHRDIDDALKRAYNDGYSEGHKYAKEKYANYRGIAHCHKATLEEIDQHGIDLWGWCECKNPIIGRWAGLANFCPWCGKVIEWGKINEEK